MTEPGNPDEYDYTQLASYQHSAKRLTATWPAFLLRRSERLRQGLFDAPAEKVAENILEDLFTSVLDWNLDDVNFQIGRADIVLSDLGIKRLVVEVKRPGTLIWHQRAVAAALDQARGYAEKQKVQAVAVSDGQMIYAADLIHGGFQDRTYAALDDAAPPLDLWWISIHGIYRARTTPGKPLLPTGIVVDPPPGTPSPGDEMLHRKYHLPAHCFAYVGPSGEPDSWKLPYLLADGTPDLKRLPKAIQAILSNYRGARVSIPREAVADVLVRLGTTAAALGKMPCQCQPTAKAYAGAHQALDQLGRLPDVGCCADRQPAGGRPLLASREDSAITR